MQKIRLPVRLLTFFLLLASLPELSAGELEDSVRYGEYHLWTLEAETLITEERPEAALQVYEKIFSAYDFVFVRDYKVAAQLSFYVNEKEQGYQYIRQAIKAGWSLKSIKRNKYIRNALTKSEWENLQNIYSAQRKEYEAQLNPTLKEEVRNLFKKDQRMALGAFLRIGDKAQQRYTISKFAPHSEQQMVKLLAILEKYGYPGEQRIGNNYWVSTIISHHNSIEPGYVQKDTLFKAMQPLLVQALQRGELSPYEFALMEDWRKAVAFARKELGYGFLYPPRTKTLNQTNQLRQKIGLRSIELRNKLVEVEEKTGMDFYLPDWVKGKIDIQTDD